MKVRKNPKCPICGPNPTITGLIDYEEFCGVRGAELRPGPPRRMTAMRSPRSSSRRGSTGGDRPFILDVRNPEEIAICRIEGSTVIPLPELPDRLGELDPSVPMVVHCKSGARSAKAIVLLREAGFPGSRT